MPRTVLDEQLQTITNDITRMGELIEEALAQSLQAMATGDEALSGKVVASDDAIDDLRAEIDRLTFQSLTLQQPLGGRDLRLLSSAPSITTDLERTGDNAVGIAKLLIRMAPLRKNGISNIEITPSSTLSDSEERVTDHNVSEATIISGLQALGQEARNMLHETMQAFSSTNAQAARGILLQDNAVDERYQVVRDDLMTIMSGIHAIPVLQQDGLAMQRMTYWLWIAHNLERIGDHCTNICERIVFYLEGDRTNR